MKLICDLQAEMTAIQESNAKLKSKLMRIVSAVGAIALED